MWQIHYRKNALWQDLVQSYDSRENIWGRNVAWGLKRFILWSSGLWQCSLVGLYQHFGETCCSIFRAVVYTEHRQLIAWNSGYPFTCLHAVIIHEHTVFICIFSMEVRSQYGGSVFLQNTWTHLYKLQTEEHNTNSVGSFLTSFYDKALKINYAVHCPAVCYVKQIHIKNHTSTIVLKTIQTLQN
jgi:hypothetical protein